MKTYVNTEDKGTLNLREDPSSTGRVLARIPYNTELEVEMTTSNWSQVTYNGITGYVMNKYLGDHSTITKEDLQKIYNSLKSTLKIIEDVLK